MYSSSNLVLWFRGVVSWFPIALLMVMLFNLISFYGDGQLFNFSIGFLLASRLMFKKVILGYPQVLTHLLLGNSVIQANCKNLVLSDVMSGGSFLYQGIRCDLRFVEYLN